MSIEYGWRAALLAALITMVSAARLVAQDAGRDVVLLHTNDFHTAFDPIAAYWLPGSPRLGGAAHLAGYIERIRAAEQSVFLFDSGDMFTGMISNLTRGEALMEMMRAMKFDAMAIGNHEFDYGAENFEKQMQRAPFPVLGANIFHKGTRHRYSRPYVIFERAGVRVGVIGIIGQDARSVALPAGITELDFEDPVTAIAPLVAELRPQVDVLVVLAHQGKTGPMQTDAEHRPELQRDFDEDIRVAGAVPGIDVLLGGHAHRGIEQPYVHPETGTLIMQTYGYGTRLGYLRLRLVNGRIVAHEGKLIKVWSDSVQPVPEVQRVVDHYQKLVAPQIGEVIAHSPHTLYRDYRAESPLGNLVADILRESMNADIGIQNAGGLRADLPAGEITKGHVLDALPFVNLVEMYEVTGAQLVEMLEQGLTLERGMIQVSGLVAKYNLDRPRGQRLVSVRIGGRALDPGRRYRVATNSFLGQGGDLYQTFLAAKRVAESGEDISTIVMNSLRQRGTVPWPKPGRLVPVKR